jgi:hypothetical protein
MFNAIVPLIFTVCSLNDSMPATYFGVKIGPNYSFFIKDATNDEIINSPRTGFVGGLFLNQNISFVGFREEILYNNKRFKMVEYGDPLDLSFRTITIPVLFRIRNPQEKVQFNLNFGVSLEFVVRNTVGSYENNVYVISTTDFFAPITLGIPVGFSFDYVTQKGIISAEFRNTFDLTRSTGLERFDVMYFLIGYGFAYPHYIIPKEIRE